MRISEKGKDVTYIEHSPITPCSRVMLCVVGLLIVEVLMTFTATPALAKQIHFYALSGSFGATTSTNANPYPLASGEMGPTAVAVDDSTHDVYVTDPGHARVEKFDSEGNFVLTFGKEVDQTTGGDVCTVISGDICKAGVPGTSPGAFASEGQTEGGYASLYVAVDNSSGPSRGDVYVADRGDSLVSKFDSSGDLIASWALDGQLNGSLAESGPFSPPGGIAVDVSGNLWVYDSEHMFEFRQDSSFVTGWNTLEFGGPGASIAVDSNDNIYVETFGHVVKFDSVGSEIGDVTELGHGLFPDGVAVDPSIEELFVDVSPGGVDEIQRYDASCHPTQGGRPCVPVESFGSGQLEDSWGLAVDPSAPGHTVYVSERGGQVLAFSVKTVIVPDVNTAKASNFATGSATINGTINPGGVELTECKFEYGETEAYGQVASCAETPAQIGAASSSVSVHADITGLQAAKTYHFRLVAANVNGSEHGTDLTFGPPLIDGEFASGIASTSGTIQALVNPNNVDTQYQIEYGTDTSYGQVSPETYIGSAGVDQNISLHLRELVPDTVYHYRISAHNVLGVVQGEDHTFTTQGVGGSLALPDGRQWELVSPVTKNGAQIYPIDLASNGAVIQASASGGAITYLTSAPTEAQPQGYANQEQVLSARTIDGWESRDITPPHSDAVGLSVGEGEEYRFFSEDLAFGALQPFGAFTPSLSAKASEQTPFVRTDYSSGDPNNRCIDSCYSPLVTSVAGYANVPPGTVFGEEGKCPPRLICGPQFVGATSDLSHVVLASPVALTATSAREGGLYEWAGGRLALVSILPGSEEAAPNNSSSSPGLGYENVVARHAISDNGLRVIWSEKGGTNHLYMRDMTVGKTVKLDAVKGGTGAGSPSPQFQVASDDGSKVFFTDTQRLTADSGAAAGEADLYQCEIVEVEGHPRCELSDLTPPVSGGSAAVQAGVLGASEDGSYVYFVAHGALAGVAENERGERAQSAQPNLYVWHAGTTKLIAVLSSEDSPDFAPTLPGLTSRVSPDGRWLAFMSQRPLTGYDNHDAVSSQPDEEVYLYDATPKTRGRALTCVSCDPTGGRPQGVEYGPGGENMRLTGGDRVWEPNQWLAANIPGWTPYSGAASLYQSRYLSNSGRLFFNSTDALVSQDTNGTSDVYQYEPEGVGSCSSSSSTFDSESNACISLVSSGTSPEESAFFDASQSGGDVFFLTAARLSPQDTDTSVDVYDAHECAVSLPCLPPPRPPVPACEGDSCQGYVSAPSEVTPASLTFSGAGRFTRLFPPVVKSKTAARIRATRLAAALKACRDQRNRHKRAACESQAKKRYGTAPKTKVLTRKDQITSGRRRTR